MLIILVIVINRKIQNQQDKFGKIRENLEINSIKCKMVKNCGDYKPRMKLVIYVFRKNQKFLEIVTPKQYNETEQYIQYLGSTNFLK